MLRKDGCWVRHRFHILQKGAGLLRFASCLLGDHRYPLRKWVMTPVDSPESSAELRYNVSHAATHAIVDRTFRAIQSRFKCLDGTKGYLQVFFLSGIKKKYLIYVTGLNVSTAIAVLFLKQLEVLIFGQFFFNLPNHKEFEFRI